MACPQGHPNHCTLCEHFDMKRPIHRCEKNFDDNQESVALAMRRWEKWSKEWGFNSAKNLKSCKEKNNDYESPY